MPTKKDIKALNAKDRLDVSDFTGDQRVVDCVTAVKNKKPVVSDVLDKNGNQYVDLVQKGGGVLGIALVGYTYILEQAGIRFLKLAGTSAGAINTSLIVVQGKKGDAHSDTLIKKLTELDLFKLVDGHPIARFLIKHFVKEPDFTARLKKVWLITILGFVLLLLAGFIGIGWQHYNAVIAIVTYAIFVLTGFYFLFLAILGTYFASLLKRLKDSGFGINPGDFFYSWVKDRMLENKVKTVDDLRAKANEGIPSLGLHMRSPRTDDISDLAGDVVFITSELVTQNKFELPKMSYLFCKPQDMDKLQPAGFVRASMSIPIFFESYYIRDIPIDDDDIKKAWSLTFNVDSPPATVRFVDGGILSNFPINLFYKDIKVPRMPTLGIDLDDAKKEVKKKDKKDDIKEDAEYWSLLGYIGRMFNTIRYYYDKDFLLKNKIMKKGIGKVLLADFNWLNFFLTNQQKVELFVRGAEAAKQFLLDFDWEDYKGERQEYFNSTQKK